MFYDHTDPTIANTIHLPELADQGTMTEENHQRNHLRSGFRMQAE